jgi:predicted amidohydrolase
MNLLWCDPILVLLLLPALVRADDVVRVGLIQMDGREFDKDYNLGRAESLIRAAAARGASIVCTPEVAVQGYPRVQLPPQTSPDDPKISEKRARILQMAEPIPGPSTDRLAGLATELHLWIVAGLDENRGGRLFNTAVLIDPNGAIVGKYSKVHLQNWMLASGVNRGDDFPVWDVAIAGVKTKVGIQICYDIQHPESTRELALGGAEIVFIPYCTTDFSRPLLVHLFQTRALENRAYLVRVNFAAPRNSGTSSLINFEGATQDELDRAEGVLVGDLNLTALRKVRSAWNKVYGPANRYPEAYRRIRAAQP